MRSATIDLISRYYDYFNKRDVDSFIALLDDNVVHDINQGETQVGKAIFAEFMAKMNRSYQETVKDLIVMASDDGSRAAAEFFIDGVYRTTDKGLPAAANQPYLLRVGAFFEINNNKISRVTNYYNLQNWLQQVKE